MKIGDILGYLEAFQSIVETGSFTQAAQKLHISQSAVSVQIRNLEDRLGSTLFHRLARNKVVLTNDGKALSENCAKFFADLRNNPILNREKSKRKIKVGAPTLFGTFVLLSELKNFKKKNPDIEFEIVFSDDLVDPITEGYDVVFRTTKEKKTSLKYTPVMTVFFGLFANLTLAKKIKSGPMISMIEKQNFLLRSQISPIWKEWLHNLPKSKKLKITKHFIIDNHFAQFEAVKQGWGFGLFTTYSVKKSDARNKLQEFFPEHRIKRTFYACIPKKFAKDSLLISLVDAVKSGIKSENLEEN